MRTLLTAAALLVALSTSVAEAQTPTEALGTCLTDNTTGRDRKDLARWIFTAIASHPDMSTLADITASEREEASRTVGALLTRLLAESCTAEVRFAVESGGSSVIEDAFGVLGEVAMDELMRNEQVSAAALNIVPYVDMARLEEMFDQE